MVYGKGICDEGLYNSSYEGKQTRIYKYWVDLIKRVYSERYQELKPTYKGCTVCDEWLYFQTFAKWFHENYYEVEGSRMHIDKDILLKGNRHYSPENCMFVPIQINSLMVVRNNQRGEYPIGVSNKRGSIVSTARDINGNKVWLGTYNTPEEAFNAYKVCKENLIKQYADIYKPNIPEKLYQALYNYKVEITD